MAIIGSNVAIITVFGLQGIETTQSTMEYFPDTGAGEESAEDTVDGWIADVSMDWLDLVDEQWTMLAVKCDKKISGVFTDFTRLVGLPGIRLGDVLPPYSTFSFRKNPDNANREPIIEREVGKGRIAISGVAEVDQNNGLATPGAIGRAATLSASILTFEPVGATSSYLMYIQSLGTVADPVEVFAPCLSVPFTRVGTQLTRKR